MRFSKKRDSVDKSMEGQTGPLSKGRDGQDSRLRNTWKWLESWFENTDNRPTGELKYTGAQVEIITNQHGAGEVHSGKSNAADTLSCRVALDLDPIENLWGDIRNAVAETKPRNAEELWTVVQSS